MLMLFAVFARGQTGPGTVQPPPVATIQNAVVANGNGTVFNCRIYGAVKVSITIAGTATVNFEGRMSSGQTFAARKGIAESDTSNTAVTSATASGDYIIYLAGDEEFRARVSGWSSGAVTVKVRGVPSTGRASPPSGGSVAGTVTTAGGTPNSLPKWLTSTTLGDSLITEASNVITIGSTGAGGFQVDVDNRKVFAYGDNITDGAVIFATNELKAEAQLAGVRGGTGVANSGKTITLGGNLVTSGAFNTTITSTATTNSTLPAGTHSLAPLDSPVFTGALTIPTPFTLGAVSVTATGTELNYVAGVTSAIQTQLNGKQASGSYAASGANSDITSLSGVTGITGGASNMTITSGTGNSRTMALQTTTSGGVATTFLTGNADQSATFAAGVTLTTGTLTAPTVALTNTNSVLSFTGNGFIQIDGTFNNGYGYSGSNQLKLVAGTANAVLVTSTTATFVGSVIAQGTTDSTTTTSGALQVAGGAAIRKRVFIDGISASAGLQTAVLCQSSGGEMIADSVACLASSARFKENIKPLASGLDEVMRFRPISYRYKAEGIFAKNANFQRERVGFLAEAVNEIDPRFVGYEADGKTPRTVGYEQMVPLLVKAIQEQQLLIQGLKGRVAVLERH